ncbi:MAG: metal-dependent transcriptional regulator [Candidatus Hydrogenedentes bacterium]|nr:metal-dependent transcriptional regulator [Candidatus Hydrogenedentota bacterium]
MILSESIEDYLKAIYTLQEKESPVSTSALAARLQVAPASVTQMLKKLDLMKPHLVRYKKHHGVELTPHGEKIAVEVIRHHRLIELFLQQALGMSWDEVDREAERLEHVVSPHLADRMAHVLGNPQFDPHGDPIPQKDGSFPVSDLMCLLKLEAGQSGVVRRVRDADPELLRYVAGLGIVPGSQIHVVDKGPFDGPIHVRLHPANGQEQYALGQTVASQIFVELVAG